MIEFNVDQQDDEESRWQRETERNLFGHTLLAILHCSCRRIDNKINKQTTYGVSDPNDKCATSHKTANTHKIILSR